MQFVLFKDDCGDNELPASYCLGAQIGVAEKCVAVVIVCEVGRIHRHICSIDGGRHAGGDYSQGN